MADLFLEDPTPLPGTSLYTRYGVHGEKLPPVYRGTGTLADALVEARGKKLTALRMGEDAYVRLLGVWYRVARVHQMKT
ncbi:hypothetical protein COY93_03390, partial [Candidatus Uhrbacteria bacterium CG_4_10_14_0_8_um_filter_58_22]